MTDHYLAVNRCKLHGRMRVILATGNVASILTPSCCRGREWERLQRWDLSVRELRQIAKRASQAARALAKDTPAADPAPPMSRKPGVYRQYGQDPNTLARADGGRVSGRFKHQATCTGQTPDYWLMFGPGTRAAARGKNGRLRKFKTSTAAKAALDKTFPVQEIT